MFLDIFIMWMVLYYAIQLVRSNSKTVQIFKGILLVLIIDTLATFLGLKTVSYVTNIFINWGFLAIIIIFQPEIRSVLERLGKTNVFSRMTTLTGNEKENLVDQIVTATMLLSQDQTGALISIEQSHTLEDFIATGTKLNSDVTAELLTSLFVTSTPLHDGAVIIQGDKIACASAYFPPTNLDLPSRYGARHRAAIGISEITDAVTIVVSEETGAISITESGKITTVNRKQLRDYLLRVICGEETDMVASRKQRLNDMAARDVIIDDTAETKTADQKLGQTSVLSKLAIRKQEAKQEETPEEKPETSPETNTETRQGQGSKPANKKGSKKNKKNGKIPVEEVVQGRREPETIAPAKEEKPDAGMTRLEEGASEIKLPRKKERPVPSYPDNNAARRFEQQKRRELEKQAALERAKAKEMAEAQRRRDEASREALRKEAEARVRQADEARRLEMERARAAAAAAAAESNRIAAQNMNNRRMSSEEVQAAREAARMQMGGSPLPSQNAPVQNAPVQNAPVQNAPVQNAPVQNASTQNTPAQNSSNVIIDRNSRQFDTTKLDISKIMGLNDDLTKTFEMLDSLEEDSSRNKGGDR